MAGRPRDSATGMRARSAQIEALERHPIIGGADHRPCTEQLVEPHFAMEDVAADEAEAAFEIERRMDLPPQHRGRKTRRVRVDRRDELVCGLFPLLVPAAPGAEVVAE